MKVGVIGDTHGAKEIIDIVIKTFGNVDLFLHTGDHWQDGAYIERETGISVLTVKGNCDQGKMPSERIFTIEGKKIFLTHGHLYGVKYNLDNLVNSAVEVGADYCIFGHTHRAGLTRKNGVCFMNPGSLTWSRTSKNFAGILMEYQDDSFEIRFLEVDML